MPVGARRHRAASIMQHGDRGDGPQERGRPALAGPSRKAARRSSPSCEDQFNEHEGPLGEREEQRRTRCKAASRRDRTAARRDRRGRSATTSLKRPRELKYVRPARAARRSSPRPESRGRAPQERELPACTTPSPRRRSPASSPSWTGIPVAKLMEGEREKLLHLDEVLHRRVDRPGRGRGEGHARPSSARAPASATRTARSARSCSSAPRASARRSWPRRWPRACLTTSATWCAST